MTKDLLYTSRFLIIFTLLTLLVIGVGAHRLINKKQDNLQRQLEQVIATTDVNDLSITNGTSAFNIVNMGKLPDGIIHLVLQNGYKKNITAYQISIGSNKTFVDSLLSVHDESLSPGNSKNEFLALEVDPDLRSKGIIILAVVFDDGTADGFAGSILEIQDYRLGEQKQIEHMYEWLTNNSVLSAKGHLDTVKELQANMLSGSEGTGTEFSKYVQFGIQDTKQRMSRQIDSILDKKDENTEKKFEALSEYLKEKALKLKTYTEAAKTLNITQ